MKTQTNHKSAILHRAAICFSAGCLAVAAFGTAEPVLAADTVFSGEFNTLLRMSRDLNKRNIYPVYEHVRLQVDKTLQDDSEISFQFGGWGRLDLGDKSSSNSTDGDVQYALISYRGAKNNLVANLGRQFVTEGVAAEIMDGLYVRQDFLYGFGAAGYVGKPVMTANGEKTVDIVYGGRLSHSYEDYYEVGFSALKSDQDDRRFREEFGADIWLRPLEDVDITGRSSYNSITSGWMEHNYNLAYSPIEKLQLSFNLSDINYKDYFHNMTMSAFSFKNGSINQDEEMLSLGGSIAYTPIKRLTITADYKNYSYKILGDANYYGGKLFWQISDSFLSGVGIYRMDGTTDRLRYSEARAWVSKTFDKLDLSLDFIALMYDKSINSIKESYTVVSSAAYTFGRKVKVGADLEYSRTPDFDSQLTGMVKLSYMFDTSR